MFEEAVKQLLLSKGKARDIDVLKVIGADPGLVGPCHTLITISQVSEGIHVVLDSMSGHVG